METKKQGFLPGVINGGHSSRCSCRCPAAARPKCNWLFRGQQFNHSNIHEGACFCDADNSADLTFAIFIAISDRCMVLNRIWYMNTKFRVSNIHKTS